MRFSGADRACLYGLPFSVGNFPIYLPIRCVPRNLPIAVQFHHTSSNTEKRRIGAFYILMVRGFGEQWDMFSWPCIHARGTKLAGKTTIRRAVISTIMRFVRCALVGVVSESSSKAHRAKWDYLVVSIQPALS